MLANPKVWTEALVQILINCGIGFGPVLFFATARGSTDKIVPPSFLIPLFDGITSFFAALTVFSFLGHISEKTGKPMDEISKEGIELAFVVYPSILQQLAWPNFWAIMFFGLLLFLASGRGMAWVSA